MHLAWRQSTVPNFAGVPAAACARAAAGAVVWRVVHPVSGRASETAARKAAVERNLVPGLLIFMVSEGMRRLYIWCIHRMYRGPCGVRVPERSPVGRPVALTPGRGL
jgi:hypothetical protein